MSAPVPVKQSWKVLLYLVEALQQQQQQARNKAQYTCIFFFFFFLGGGGGGGGGTAYFSVLLRHVIYALLMTSSHGKFFRITGHLSGKSTYPQWIPSKRPVMRSFTVLLAWQLNVP